MATSIKVEINKDEILSQKQWEEIADIIAIEGTEGLKKEILDKALLDIKQEALKYKTIYENNLNQLSQLKNLLKRQSALRKIYGVKNIEQNIIEYSENKKIILNILNTTGPELYKALFLFQEKMNYFLGQKAKTIIVHDGELYEVDSEKYMNLIKYDYNKTALTARYNITQENLKNSMKKISMEKDRDLQQIDNVKHGYQSALWRYNRSKETRDGVALILWRNPTNLSKWNGMTVSAKGDISEAYANILLTHQEHLFPNNIIEEILEVFMKQFVQNVDSTSGMLEGDVTVKNIEYAIKATDASALSFRQFNTIANFILKDNFSQQKLLEYKQKLHNKGKKRNKLYENLTEEVAKDMLRVHQLY